MNGLNLSCLEILKKILHMDDSFKENRAKICSVYEGVLLLWLWLTHSCSRIPQDYVVWIYNTFDNNFEIQNGFTKYLKGSCKQCSD